MKYLVSSINNPFDFEPIGQPRELGTPKTALEEWFKLNKKHPTCTSLRPQTNEDAREVLKWASNNKDEIKAWATRYDCHYKIEYLLKSIDDGLNKEKLISWEYDELFPFCMG